MIIMFVLKRYLIPLITGILLILSFFIIEFPGYLPRDPITLEMVFIIVIASSIIILLGIVLAPLILKDSVIKLKDHLVVKALREKKCYDLWVLFPTTMIMEELIFRLYLFGFLFTWFDLYLTVAIGTVAFTLYHVHIWFEFQDKNITLAFFFFATLLGILLSFSVYFFGVIPCVVIHWASAILVFINLEKKIEKQLRLEIKNEA